MRSKKLAWFLIISPPVCLVGSLLIFPALQFWAASTMSEGGSNGVMIFARVIRSLVGLFGIYGVAGLFTALPIGIFLLVKSDGASSATHEIQKQNQGTTPHAYVAPTYSSDEDFARGASFSAFMLPLVFIIGNKLWKHLFIFLGIMLVPIIALVFSSFMIGTLGGTFLAIILSFLSLAIPIIGVLALSIYLCVVGRRCAWGDGGKWESMDTFRKRQKTIFWITIGLIILIVMGSVLKNVLQKEEPLISKTVDSINNTRSDAIINNATSIVDDSIKTKSENETGVEVVSNSMEDLEMSIGLRKDPEISFFQVDKDKDGLDYSRESIVGSSDDKRDTDDDGYGDYDEVQSGYDPTVKGGLLPKTNDADVIGKWEHSLTTEPRIEFRNDGSAIISQTNPDGKISLLFFWEVKNGNLWFAGKKEDFVTSKEKNNFAIVKNKEGLLEMTFADGLVATYRKVR